MLALIEDNQGYLHQLFNNISAYHRYTKNTFTTLGLIISRYILTREHTSYVNKGFSHGHMSQQLDGPPTMKTHATPHYSYTTYGMEPDLKHAILIRKGLQEARQPLLTGNMVSVSTFRVYSLQNHLLSGSDAAATQHSLQAFMS